MVKARLRNTADHYLIPGDEGQVIDIDASDYRVVEVKAIREKPSILTYGLRLIPSEVDVELEPDLPVVVQ